MTEPPAPRRIAPFTVDRFPFTGKIRAAHYSLPGTQGGSTERSAYFMADEPSRRSNSFSAAANAPSPQNPTGSTGQTGKPAKPANRSTGPKNVCNLLPYFPKRLPRRFGKKLRTSFRTYMYSLSLSNSRMGNPHITI